MNVAVIGACGFGRRHAEAFEAVGCDVVAVADIAPELDAVAARFAARPYRDYRELLRHPGLDALSIGLPPRLHPAAIRAACDRGLPVLCEKPVAPTAAEADALVRDLGADAPVMVGFALRYHPAYRRLRERIREGRLGRVRTVLARKCWRAGGPWRRERGGGAVFVKDIHYYDLLPWLLDAEPDACCAYGGPSYQPGDVEDAYQLLMAFPDGIVFHLDSAWWTLPDRVNTFEVIGDRARAVIDGDRLTIHDDGAHDEELAGEPMMTAEIRAFVEWRTGGGPRPPGLREAQLANRRAQRVADLLRAGRDRSG